MFTQDFLTSKSFNMSYTIWIDVSKDTLHIFDAHLHKSYTIINHYQEIIYTFSSFHNYIFFYEATWKEDKQLNKALNDLWVTQYKINPDKIHFLSKYLSDRNKTDFIDAKKIAHMWELLLNYWNINNNCNVSNVNANWVNYLTSIMSQINTLKKHIKRFKQNISNIDNDIYADKSLNSLYLAQIKLFENKINSLYSKLETLIWDLWFKDHYNNLLSIPSIWEKVWIELLIFFIELKGRGFKKSDRSKLKAFVWIDPIQNQSWKINKKAKITKRWRKTIRSILYYPSLGWYQLSLKEKYKKTNLAKFFTKINNKFKSEWEKYWKSVTTAMSKKLLLTAWWIFWNNEHYQYL